MDLVYKKLNEVLSYEQPTKYIVDTTDYDNDFDIPVLTAGKSFILGYTDDKTGIFENVPAIIFDDFTTSFHYVDFPFKVKSSAMKILTPKEDFVDLKYVYQQMKQVRIDTQLHKRYWISRFSEKTIPFPKVDIDTNNSKNQQRIAAILGDAAALRDKTAQLHTEYDLLAQSIFLEMFGDPGLNPKNWKKTKCGDFIGYLADIGSNGANKVVSEKLVMSEEEDYALMIRTTNFTNKDFVNKAKYVSKEVYNFFKKSQIFGGEIIMNKIGSAGDFWLMPHLDRPVSLGLNQFVIRLKDISTLYFYYFLSTDYGRINIKSRTNGAATKSITKTAVRDLPILVPPINLQNQFADKIGLIEQQKTLAKQELQESENLFNCLLQKAFKGELV